LSLRAVVGDYCEQAVKLPKRMLGEAVDGYLSTVASVKRKDIKESVEEFIIAEEPRTPGNLLRVHLRLTRAGQPLPNAAKCRA